MRGMEMNIFLPGRPVTATHQMKQVNWKTRTFYEPSQVKAARAELTQKLMLHKPDAPYQGPIAMSVVWYYPTRTKQKDGQLKTTRPDVDNSVKLMLDVMTKLGFWGDDAQVGRLTLEKRWIWNQAGGTLIQLKEDL